MPRRPRLAFALPNGWGIKSFVHAGVLDLLAPDFEIAAWAQPSVIPAWQRLMAAGATAHVQLLPMPDVPEQTVERLVRQTEMSLFLARHKIETEAIKIRSSRKAWQRRTAGAVNLFAQSPLGGVGLNALKTLRSAT